MTDHLQDALEWLIQARPGMIWDRRRDEITGWVEGHLLSALVSVKRADGQWQVILAVSGYRDQTRDHPSLDVDVRAHHMHADLFTALEAVEHRAITSGVSIIGTPFAMRGEP